MKIPTMASKEQFGRTIILHHLIYTCYAELSQLREGLLLHTLNFSIVIEDHPSIIRPILIAGKINLTAAQVQDIFRIKYHEEGSNTRRNSYHVFV